MVRILSRDAVREAAWASPGELKAVLICEPGLEVEVDDIAASCRSALCLAFGDYVNEQRPTAPERRHIEEALAWDYPDVVSCRLGLSRSAALAYLIECKHGTPPSQAAGIWDPKRHYPNELVLRHGVAVLGEEIVPPIREFYRQAAAHKGWRVSSITKHFQ